MKEYFDYIIGWAEDMSQKYPALKLAIVSLGITIGAAYLIKKIFF
jgi:hypothetical protein